MPSNDRGICSLRHVDRSKGFFKHAVEMGSGAMIFFPRFIEIGLGIQKGRNSQTHRQQCDLISLLSFFSKCGKWAKTYEFHKKIKKSKEKLSL
jgi:hypothetical protein